MATILLCTSSFVSSAENGQIKISVVLSSDSRLYYEAVEGIEDTLDNSSIAQYKLKTFNNIQRTRAEDVYENADYVIAVGSKAANYVIQHPTQKPVLSILVPKQSYRTLVNTAGRELGSNYSVLYLGQPASRLLALAKIVTGHNKNGVGMVFGPSSKQQLDAYLSEAEKLSINLSYIEEDNDKRALDAIKNLVSSTSVYVALYDRKVMNRKTAKWLLYLAGVNRKPVIGYSQSYVDAGALAAVYTSPYQAGENAVAWLSENSSGNKDITWNKYPNLFAVKINKKTMRKLNMILASPGSIETKIRESEARK